MPTTEELKQYLTTDPLNLGLSKMWELNDDTIVANTLNDTSLASVDVPYPLVVHELMGLLIPTTLAALYSHPMCSRILDEIESSNRPAVQLHFLALALIGILAPDDTKKLSEYLSKTVTLQCSPAVKQWGEGSYIHAADLTAALPDEVKAIRDKEAAQLAYTWKVETIAALIEDARLILDSRVEKDPYSKALMAAYKAKGAPLTDTEIATLAKAEMMRLGGGK